MNESNNLNNLQPDNTKKSKKRIIILLIALIVLLGISITIFIVKPFDKKKSSETKKEETDNKSSIEITDYKEHNGKEIVVYKYTDEYGTTYSDELDDAGTGEKVGSIKCITTTCKPADYDPFSNKYALIDEKDGTISLYDYTKNILVYNSKKVITSPLPDDFYEDRFGLILDDDNNAYGFFMNNLEDKVWYTNIYSLLSNKLYSNIEGTSNVVTPSHHPSVISKRYYPITLNYQNDKKDDVDVIIDLTTGKKVTTYDGMVADVIELKDNSYILLSSENSYSVCDIKGNTKIKDISLDAYSEKIFFDSNKLVFEKNKKFYVYDSNLKLVKESKEYNSIFKTDKDYVLVVDGTKLQLVDHNDKVLATFISDYNDTKYHVHAPLSGWYTDNGKNGIYVVVEQDDPNITYEEVIKYNPNISKETFESESKGYEYYYIPTTKEIGKIPTIIGGYAKPVLYLYPTKKTKVTVNFEHEDMLTTTYPKFNKEWSVTASPNGDLYDKNGKYYYALYWEENGNHRVDFSEGFYVEKDNAIEFLEEKLEYIGLNKKERNEFIMYWLPILERNKKNLVYFELTKERDSYNKLRINPQPDSLLRVAIHVKKVNKKTNIKEQKLTKFNRKGFTAIEWGGVQY